MDVHYGGATKHTEIVGRAGKKKTSGGLLSTLLLNKRCLKCKYESDGPTLVPNAEAERGSCW